MGVKFFIDSINFFRSGYEWVLNFLFWSRIKIGIYFMWNWFVLKSNMTFWNRPLNCVTFWKCGNDFYNFCYCGVFDLLFQFNSYKIILRRMEKSNLLNYFLASEIKTNQYWVLFVILKLLTCYKIIDEFFLFFSRYWIEEKSMLIFSTIF